MRLLKIPKRSGGHRVVCACGKAQKKILRDLLPSLNHKQLLYCDGEIVHGFIQGRSVVSNARKHIGYAYTLNMDLKDFFDTVTPDMVTQYLSAGEMELCFIDGHAYQGLPTSPAVANLAAIALDKALKEYIATIDDEIVLTRYADDISVSFNEYTTYQLLKAEIPRIVEAHGFKVNPKKTRLSDARYGYREITGLKVGPHSVSAGRKLRRKIRALKHYKSKTDKPHWALKGLEEWYKVRPPHPPVPVQLDNLWRAVKAKYILASITLYDGPEAKMYKAMVDQVERVRGQPSVTKQDVKAFIKSLVHKDRRILDDVSSVQTPAPPGTIHVFDLAQATQLLGRERLTI